MFDSMKVLYFLLGIVGLVAALWINFTVDLPLFMYFMGMPFIVIPSLLTIAYSVNRDEHEECCF